MPRIDQEPSFVLHRRSYGESSLLVELMTRDHGRVGLVAKGARRTSSRARGMLEPFQPLLVSWVGKGELGTLTGADRMRAAAPLTGERLVSGLYINELMYRLCGRHDPYPELFASYSLALEGLRSDAQIETGLRVFEKRLLDALGYGLVLTRTADTEQPVKQEETYRYHPESGPVLVESGGRAGCRANKKLVPAQTEEATGSTLEVTGATLLALAREELHDEALLREAKRLMRATLRQHLGDRPLASREIFRGLSSRA